jgi:hypothetical protein
MNKRLQVLAIVLAFAALPVLGYHQRHDLSDGAAYERISNLVSSASKAEMESQELPEGGFRTAVTVPCVRQLEDLIVDGLLAYAAMLDGNVGIAIELGDSEVTLVITQR